MLGLYTSEIQIIRSRKQIGLIDTFKNKFTFFIKSKETGNFGREKEGHTTAERHYVCGVLSCLISRFSLKKLELS